MKKLSLVCILIFSFLITGLVSAQQNTQLCQYIRVDNRLVREGFQTFPDCAQILIAHGIAARQNDATGYWGRTTVYVNNLGEVYYINNSNTWTRWGTVDLPQASSTEQTIPLTMNQVIALGQMDINHFWQAIFTRENVRYNQPDVQIINRGDIRTWCGTVGDSTGPAYCSADNTIYLPYGFMDDQYWRIGDFAVVIIMAHEWGHTIEAHLDMFSNNPTRTTELLADCLAGGYTNYLIHESSNAIIEDGDVEEAATALFEAGDNLPWFDDRTHGSGKERRAAFELGMSQGWEACFEVSF